MSPSAINILTSSEEYLIHLHGFGFFLFWQYMREPVIHESTVGQLEALRCHPLILDAPRMCSSARL